MKDCLDKDMVLQYLRCAALGYQKLRMRSRAEICNNLISMIESGEWDYTGGDDLHEVFKDS